jgi:CPA1 family monovalent cation:H+ antiporter
MSIGDVAANFGKGLFAGLAGTAAMTVSSTLEMKLSGRAASETPAQAAEAALSRLDELADEGGVRKDTTTRMRDLYEYRRRRFAARHSEQTESGEEGDGYEERSLAYQRFRQELLGAERAELLRLRSEGRISDEVRRRVERSR